MPLSEHLIRGLKAFINIEYPDQYLFNGNKNRNVEEIDVLVPNRKDFDSRYSQRGGQWVIKTISKKPASPKRCTPTLCDTAMRLICWKTASRSSWCRNFWVMSALRVRWNTCIACPVHRRDLPALRSATTQSFGHSIHFMQQECRPEVKVLM